MTISLTNYFQKMAFNPMMHGEDGNPYFSMLAAEDKSLIKTGDYEEISQTIRAQNSDASGPLFTITMIMAADTGDCIHCR